MTDALTIRPHKGPQEQFLATDADVAFYGGEAGGGKSFALLLDPLRFVTMKDFRAIAFRRTYNELKSGLWDEAQRLYPALGAQLLSAQGMRAEFPSGAKIQFSHLQLEKDKYKHQGIEYAVIYFDELTHFSESVFWYILSRNRTTASIRPYIRATLNPDPDHFARMMIDWWIDDDGYAIRERSGVIRWFVRVDDSLEWFDSKESAIDKFPDAKPMSFTFIAAGLDDNPTLMEKDPGYKARLAMLPFVERMRLLKGNWDVRHTAGNVFNPRKDLEIVDALPDGLRFVRGWDKAATKPSKENPDPDYTAGALVGLSNDGDVYIADLTALREGPRGVEFVMQRQARADKCRIAIYQDPGQAGKVDVSHTMRLLDGFDVVTHRPTKDKLTQYGPLRSAMEGGRVKLLRADWNARFMSQLEAFDGTGRTHDDMIDAVNIAYLDLVENKSFFFI